MTILAIDPGNEQSAFVLYAQHRLANFGTHTNDAMLKLVRDLAVAMPGAHLAVEMIASYGMAVGREVFDTCVWIGRYIQAWESTPGAGPVIRVYRRDVKMHLCNNNGAKDSNIRAALIDRFGPGKDKAIGKKKTPGPLFGVSADEWAALAVAVTYDDGAVRGVA